MNSSSPYILVVDDQLGVRRLIQEVLRDIGYPVVTVVNGQEAVAAVTAEKPALALLDMKMPVMDGLEALRIMKQQYPDLPVIMMTAVGDGDRINEAIASGAATCISKPFDVFVVRRLVKRVLLGEEGPS